MKQNDMKDPLAAVEISKNSLASLREQRTNIIAEEQALIQKKQDLKAQPVPISDVKQALMNYVDARASIFLNDGLHQYIIRANDKFPCTEYRTSSIYVRMFGNL